MHIMFGHGLDINMKEIKIINKKTDEVKIITNEEEDEE